MAPNITSPERLTQEMVNQGVYNAFSIQGYVENDGKRDMRKMREHVRACVCQSKVLTRREKATKAITRGDLIAAVFPKVPGPGDWEGESNPTLAEAIYRELNKQVWSETRADGPVQDLIGLSMGNGYLGCRCKVTTDQVDAAYVTDSLDLILEDYAKPVLKRASNGVEGATRVIERAVLRQPHNGQKFIRQYTSALRTSLDLGQGQLRNTLEAVTATPDNTEEGGDE